MHRSTGQFRGIRSGQITVMFAAGLLTLVGMLSLTVDVGLFYSVKAQLQAAADVALISCVGQLPPQASFEEQQKRLLEVVTAFQQANFGPKGATGLLSAAHEDESWRIFDVTAFMDPEQKTLARAELTCRYELPTAFARVFGLDNVEIGVVSNAEVLHVNRHGQDLLVPRLVE